VTINCSSRLRKQEGASVGAKPYLLIDDIDDRGFMTRLAQAVYEELPEPKPKKAKRKGGQENGKNGL